MTRYLSVCSGIECASVAWEPLGWTPVAFSEIEPFPCAVLEHRFPTVPNVSDLTRWREWSAELLTDADVLIGGTPCQAFSVAGKRGGMDDERGALSRTFAELADAIDDLRVDAGREPATVVWENVPGVLSDRTNGFGCLLGALAGSGAPLARPRVGSWANAGVVAGPRRVVAWRILDAQHFGVAQRRRRVFLLARGGVGAWSVADALLPLGEGVRGNPAAGREARQGAAAGATSGLDGGSLARCLTHGSGGGHRYDAETETLIAHAFDARQSDVCQYGDRTGPLDTDGQTIGVLSFDLAQITSKANRTRVEPGAPSSTLAKASAMHTAGGFGVRRLTPRECERLQGLPDEWTAVPYRGKPAADGPRYRAIGNGMAVPCVRWIGRRLEAVQ